MSAASILLHSGASVSAASASVAASVAGAAYLVAALLFILSLHGLSKHETARRGVLFGIGGMVIAIAATIWLTVEQLWGQPQATIGLTLLVVAVLIGGSIGLWRARVVEMTGMPELIALLHSFVGLAAVIVGWNGALDPGEGANAVQLAIADDEMGSPSKPFGTFDQPRSGGRYCSYC